jgi:hypothetical protein
MIEGRFNEIKDQYIALIEQQKRAYQDGYYKLLFTCDFLLNLSHSLFIVPYSRDPVIEMFHCFENHSSPIFVFFLSWRKVLSYLLEMEKPYTQSKDAKVSHCNI